MNLYLTWLELICFSYQLYQYEETCAQNYRSHVASIRFYFLLGGILWVGALFMPMSWYLVLCAIGGISICLLYRTQEHWIQTQLGLVVSYILAIGCFFVVRYALNDVGMLESDGYMQRLSMLCFAFLIQLILQTRRNKGYDQMYAIPVGVMAIALLFVSILMAQHQGMKSNSSSLLVVYFMYLLMMVLYRFCYCLEVSKEKELIALKNTYTIIGNKEKYEALQKENDYILKNLHDMKKQLRMIQSIQDQAGLQAYSSRIQEKADELLHVKESGNTLIDHILQRYRLQFYEANIQWNVESEDIDYDFMDPIDICAVLCNMLDNAYESCLQCETRFILLKFRMVHGQVFWKMKNSMAATLVEKEDAFAHGFGLHNMERIAQRYHGKLTCTKDVPHAIYTTIISFSSTTYVEKMTTSTRYDSK